MTNIDRPARSTRTSSLHRPRTPTALIAPVARPVRETFKGHNRPASGCYFGAGREPVGAGRLVTFRAAGRVVEVLDNATGEQLATVRGAGRFWWAPAGEVSEAQLAEVRVTAAHVEADLYAYIRWATSGRSTEPTVALRHSSLSCEQSQAAQVGNGALALALAERVADLQEAYDAWRAERDRQVAETRAQVIAERAAAADPGEIVVIPCGSRKLDRAAPAGELYVGSYHRACARAAAARGGRVLIISAKHGLLDPSTVIEPYELRMGQAGSVTGRQLREQAARLGVLSATRITVLAGRTYAALAKEVWGSVEQPLDGTRGIGEQLARLAGIAATPRPIRGRPAKSAPTPAALPDPPVQLTLFDLDTVDRPAGNATGRAARCVPSSAQRPARSPLSTACRPPRRLAGAGCLAGRWVSKPTLRRPGAARPRRRARRRAGRPRRNVDGAGPYPGTK